MEPHDLIKHLQKRIDVIKANRNELFDKNVKLEAELNTKDESHKQEIFSLNDKCVTIRKAKDAEIDRLKEALEVAKSIIKTPYKRHNIATSLEKIVQALKGK